MKTKFLSLFAILTLSITLFGQVTVVDSFKIEPVSPTINDDINLLVYYDSVPGCNISVQKKSISNDTIPIISTITSKATECVAENYIDTISIGKLNADTYTVSHKLDDNMGGKYIADIYLTLIVEGNGTDETNSGFTYTNTGLTFTFSATASGKVKTWEWHFGDGTQSQEQNPVHLYPKNFIDSIANTCLTITYDNDSVEKICKEISILKSSNTTKCTANFTYKLQPSKDSDKDSVTYQFYDISNGDVTGWLWNFGDGNTSTLKNPYNTYKYNGELNKVNNIIISLTIYTSDSCQSTVQKTIVLGTSKYAITGTIYTGKDPLNNGTVIVYKKENDKCYPAGVDTVKDNGKYQIDDLNSGKYIVYALPDGSKAPGYFPTYYANNLHWKSVDAIDVNSNLNDVDIDLIKTYENSNGSGQIKGTVIFKNDTIINSKENIPVIIATKEGVELNSTSTDKNGNFEFKDLLYGEYLIYPEIPNFDKTEDYTITLSPERSVQESIQLIADESKTVTNIPNYMLAQENIVLRYVPQSQELNIKLKSDVTNRMELQVINSVGVVVKYQSLNMNNIEENVSVNNLSRGLYIVKATSGKNLISTYKFVK